jgi:hypothetical protein
VSRLKFARASDGSIPASKCRAVRAPWIPSAGSGASAGDLRHRNSSLAIPSLLLTSTAVSESYYYYYCYTGDAAAVGPVTEEELVALVQTCQLSADVQIWAGGVAEEWRSLPEIYALIAGRAPEFPKNGEQPASGVSQRLASKPVKDTLDRRVRGKRPPSPITGRALLEWANDNGLNDSWVALMESDSREASQLNLPAGWFPDVFYSMDSEVCVPMAHSSWRLASGEFAENDWITVDFPRVESVQQSEPALPLTTRNPPVRLVPGEMMRGAARIEEVPDDAYHCPHCRGWVLSLLSQRNHTCYGPNGNPLFPSRVWAESREERVCSRCRNNVSVSAPAYREQLRRQAEDARKQQDFKAKHPILYKLKLIFSSGSEG